jgi:bisphosphoglycerate-dependent phosphoglycerate mutase
MGKTMIEFEPTTAKTDSLIRRLNKIRGKKVLIVGHANTIPAIILGLSGITITPIADTDFDNLYTVRIRRFFGTTKTLVHTTYGVITN